MSRALDRTGVDARHEAMLTSLSRRLATTMSRRARVCGRSVTFIAATELRALLSMPDVELVEVDEDGRIVRGVAVVDVEDRLRALQRKAPT